LRSLLVLIDGVSDVCLLQSFDRLDDGEEIGHVVVHFSLTGCVVQFDQWRRSGTTGSSIGTRQTGRRRRSIARGIRKTSSGRIAAVAGSEVGLRPNGRTREILRIAVHSKI